MITPLDSEMDGASMVLTPDTMRVFNHARQGRVCVYRPIPPSGRLTWCSRSEITGRWMPCGNAHPQTDVITIPVDQPPDVAAVLTAAAARIDLEVASEVQRLTTAGCPEPWLVPLLSNWLGGLTTAAAVLRLEDPNTIAAEANQ